MVGSPGLGGKLKVANWTIGTASVMGTVVRSSQQENALGSAPKPQHLPGLDSPGLRDQAGEEAAEDGQGEKRSQPYPLCSLSTLCSKWI